MTAAAMAVAPVWTPGDAGASSAADPRALLMAARLAGAILRPAGLVDDAYLSLPPLAPQQVRAAAAVPGFSRAVNRAVRREIGLDRLKLPRDLPRRLSERSASRLAVLLVVEPSALLHRAAAIVAAGILHRQIIQLMMKDQRAAARTAMGEEAFQVATQEAPMLNASLAALDRGVWKFAFPAATGPDNLQHPGFSGVCGEAMCRFVEAAEPSLLGLFSCRWPVGARPDDKSRAIASMSEAHCAQIVKLLRRRLPEWADFIG